MACFTVTGAEAIVVSAATLTIKILENKGVIKYKTNEDGTIDGAKWSKKLGVLNGMLWGGTVLLALEHVFSGEVTPFPPFFTAAATAEGLSEMFAEMSTVGVAMALTLTGVWAIGLLIYSLFRKKKLNEKKAEVK